MFVVLNRIPVRREFREAFEARFRDRAREVDRAPGFLRTWVLRPADPDGAYVVLTAWASEEAFEEWRRSEAFHRGHARPGALPPEAYLGPAQVERYQVVLDSAQETPPSA